MLNVSPEELTAASAQISAVMARVQAAISSTSAATTAPVPAAIDEVSVLASTNFGAHGVNYTTVGTVGNVELARSAAGFVQIATNYVRAETAATAALI